MIISPQGYRIPYNIIEAVHVTVVCTQDYVTLVAKKYPITILCVYNNYYSACAERKLKFFIASV